MPPDKYKTVRYIAIALLLSGFIGGKIFILLNKKETLFALILGAILLIFSETATAGSTNPAEGDYHP